MTEYEKLQIQILAYIAGTQTMILMFHHDPKVSLSQSELVGITASYHALINLVAKATGDTTAPVKMPLAPGSSRRDN